MNEKRTDTRRVACRIQLGGVAVRLVVAAEKCFAFAPTAAADDLVSTLNNKVSSFVDQLSIYAKDRTKRRFYLRPGIVVRLQSANRKPN